MTQTTPTRPHRTGPPHPSGATVPAPERLQRAIHHRAALQADGLFFAPIRHHSPACATAVAALITEVRPTVVLIEGPQEYSRLIPALLDPQTRPPVAILSQNLGSHDEDARTTGFFPLADYSPEWVALRTGADVGAQLAFIDKSWAQRDASVDLPEVTPRTPVTPGDEPNPTDSLDAALTRSIQSERYLAHSRTIAELARRERCRDHDELWDQLMEIRTQEDMADWRTVVNDVFWWSALARLDYEPEVLVAEGSIAREGVMAAAVADWRRRVDGPIVVVTGAFHTLALVEAQSGAEEGEVIRRAAPTPVGLTQTKSTAPTATVHSESALVEDAWLIRYDFTRLDSLRGYSAGMPSPGYYQRVWEALQSDAPFSGERLAIDLLGDVAEQANGSQTETRISFAELSAATSQALGLAALRGRPWPGRTDILDAVLSCYVSNDVGPSSALRAALSSVLAGTRLGEVPRSVASPPLVAEAHARARALRFSVADSTRRTAVLETQTTARHRERSQFLALMSFLETGFCSLTSGPDLVSGTRSGRLTQEWQYAWSPVVETALVELSAEGASLTQIASARLRRLERDLDPATSTRSAQAATQLLAQAVVLGLAQRSTELVGLVERHLDADTSLSSLVAAGERLLALWAARDQLKGLTGEVCARLLDRTCAALAYQVPACGSVAADAELATIEVLASVRTFLRACAHERALEVDTSAVTRAFDRMREAGDASPGIQGALVAFAAVDGTLVDDAVDSQVTAMLRAGADIDSSVRFLGGFMKAAPDVLLYSPGLFSAVHTTLLSMSGEAFMAYLPDLRRAMSWLKPAETARLASQVATLLTTDASEIDLVRTDLTEADLREGSALEVRLRDSLADDGLVPRRLP